MPDIVKRTITIPQGAKIGPDGRPIYGAIKVPADCLAGLAVHKDLGGSRWKWMLTHESSGMKLDRLGAMTKARAVENMRLATALPFDWTLPEKETLEALRESRGIVDAISQIAVRE